MNARRMLLLAFGVGLVARLSLLITTVGTSDVVYKSVWASLALKHGTAEAYNRSPYLNEPPLAVETAAQLERISALAGLAFGDLYRLMQILADIGSAFCLIFLTRRLGVSSIFPAALWLLSPAAIFISGFHCNIDSTMIFLSLLSAALLTARKPQDFLSGVALGLAIGIKIVPLLLVPFFFLALGRRAWRFLAGLLPTVALIFGIPVAMAGSAVLRNVFGYAGLGNWWGVVSILTALQRWTGLELAGAATSYINAGQIIVMITLFALAVIFWRALASRTNNSALLLTAIATAFSLILFVAPGFGVQYLLWPLPWLPFAFSRRDSVMVQAIVSAFLAFVYTHWSGGWPWRFANSDAPGATTDAMVYSGWAVWLALGYCAAVGITRLARSKGLVPAF